jgi:hypothetical protein
MAGKWADMGRAPYSVARVRIARIALIVAPRALSPPPTADALQEASPRDAVVTQPLCAPARTALVLAGGGAKGAAHIGVIEVLDSLDIHPDIVVGRHRLHRWRALRERLLRSGDRFARLHVSDRQSLPAVPPQAAAAHRRGAAPVHRLGDVGQSQLILQNGTLHEGDVVAFMNALMPPPWAMRATADVSRISRSKALRSQLAGYCAVKTT